MIQCNDGKLRPRIKLTDYLEALGFTQETLDQAVAEEGMEFIRGHTSESAKALIEKRMAMGDWNLEGLSAQRVKDGTHNFLDRDFHVKRSQKLLKEGRHNFQDSSKQSELANRKFKCAECDKVSTAGGMSLHHKATGHKGKERAHKQLTN